MATTRRKNGKKGKLSAQGINDFRIGIDRVERRDGKAFVVDGRGFYAPVEFEGDIMPPNFIENLAILSDAHAATMFEAIRLSPYLSHEGKSERMTALLQSGRVRLRFEIVTEKPLRPKKSPEAQIFDVAMALGEV